MEINKTDRIKWCLGVVQGEKFSPFHWTVYPTREGAWTRHFHAHGLCRESRHDFKARMRKDNVVARKIEIALVEG